MGNGSAVSEERVVAGRFIMPAPKKKEEDTRPADWWMMEPVHIPVPATPEQLAEARLFHIKIYEDAIARCPPDEPTWIVEGYERLLKRWKEEKQ